MRIGYMRMGRRGVFFGRRDRRVRRGGWLVGGVRIVGLGALLRRLRLGMIRERSLGEIWWVLHGDKIFLEVRVAGDWQYCDI